MTDLTHAALSQPEPAGLSDEELLRVYGLAKRDHCYEGPIDDWPKRAERAATVAGLRAAIAADRARRPPEPGEVQELVGLIRQSALAWEPDATLLGNMTARQLARAADLLAQRHPQPVAVSERLPGPEDMTEDGEVWIEDPGHDYPLADAGDYDWEPHKWILRPIGKFDAKNGLRWLPAHALPLPGEVES